MLIILFYSMISLTFVVNESTPEEATFRYATKEPLRGYVEENKSNIKVSLTCFLFLFYIEHKNL